MRTCWPLVAAGIALVMSPHTRAQTPPLNEVLQRAQRYVAQWVPQLANIVAVEDYEQRMTLPARPLRTLKLKSDILLVRYPGADVDWMFFRDVTESDGRPQSSGQDRLLYLFQNQTAGTADRASRISNEAVRYSLPGATFAATNPLLTVALMQTYYQTRFRFTLGDIDRSVGATARVIRFEEIEELKPNGAEDGGRKETLPVLLGAAGRVRGSTWVEQETGRILKTEARIGDLAQRSTTTTTFGEDDRLAVMVPKEMRTTWRNENTPVNGTAKYANYRRFQVSAETPLLQLPQ